MAEHLSTRVNAARLPEYIGRTVRLTCKTLKFQGDSAMVETPDGAEVTIKLPMQDPNMSDTYVEVIGNVIDSTTIKMMACINLGPDLDMKLVNDTIELIHDPRFATKMFG